MAARDKLRPVRGILRRFTTPLLPDDYTHLVNPLWSARELRGKIISARPGPDQTIDLVIEPGWGMTTDFQPGQYIGIGVMIDGRYVWRSYSLTCTPQSLGDRLSITVKAIPKGKLSNHLTQVQPGTIIRLAEPAGEFFLPTPLPEKVLFLAAGSGITPVVSMVRWLAERPHNVEVALVYTVRNREDLLFAADIAAAKEQGAQVFLHFTAEKGRLGAAGLMELVPDFASRLVFISGSQSFIADFAPALEAAGATVKTEQFTLDRSHLSKGGQITFSSKDVTTQSDGATTILEAGEAAGVALPFGCRMGICQTCVQQVADGFVQDLRTGEVKGPGERVRTCVCVPAGDVTF